MQSRTIDFCKGYIRYNFIVCLLLHLYGWPNTTSMVLNMYKTRVGARNGIRVFLGFTYKIQNMYCVCETVYEPELCACVMCMTWSGFSWFTWLACGICALLLCLADVEAKHRELCTLKNIIDSSMGNNIPLSHRQQAMHKTCWHGSKLCGDMASCLMCCWWRSWVLHPALSTLSHPYVHLQLFLGYESFNWKALKF